MRTFGRRSVFPLFDMLFLPQVLQLELCGSPPAGHAGLSETAAKGE